MLLDSEDPSCLHMPCGAMELRDRGAGKRGRGSMETEELKFCVEDLVFGNRRGQSRLESFGSGLYDLI